MNHPVVIRPIQPEDWAAWEPLWDGYNAFYGRSGPSALPADVTQTTWARFFDAYEPVHALVAESDGHLLGLAHFLYHRSTIQLAPSCYAVSQRKRKRVEEPFGWGKLIGQIRQVKQRGKAQVNTLFQTTMMGWNLVRMRNILAASQT